jgi:glucose-1-phosphate cytidylyltransferase
MKVIILAGGKGSRISEETETIPKPMVAIGGKPLLWHIMKLYSHYGFNDFIVCLGYKGYLIKEYFSHYFLHTSDVTINITRNKIHSSASEPWRVTLVDTGLETMTGGRIKRVRDYVKNKTFMLTYGDGVSNVNIRELIKFHKKSGAWATVTTVQPPGRFGALDLKHDLIIGIREKPKGDGGWINGGFFVLEPKVFDFIKGDNTIWEQESMNALAKSGKLSAFKHDGFWQCMDTLRDKKKLEELWNSEKAKWKI